ncbi:PRD domain-containing protein [Pantoea sp. ACRSH]|uniref:BglG family transcription antiterminator LicT n=1 Tax=unclassified Pantoea TaxID=2630326 RepID=UPI001EF55EE5|nr:MULTISPECIES: PRD domain-containing protein [unclassified Pantoea]MCG7367658.1 PRD domain-containing protein [Pantoea sp. ACRSH]MCG7398755.1 PRD domain-containing protein [Pantoea sp. ACRSC]
MRIAKILNNNAVIVVNAQQREEVVMGSGLAYKKRPGEVLDATRIEKVFCLQSDELTSRLGELLRQIPLEVMIACDRIIAQAAQQLGELHESIYLTLTDHCHCAIERHRQGLSLKNALLWDIARLYPRELALGKEACAILAHRLNIQLPEDEAGFIALHLVTAQLNRAMPEVMEMTRVMQDILDFVEKQLQLTYIQDSLSYQRFVTHLKFFAQRMRSRTSEPAGDDRLCNTIKANYVTAWRCAKEIASMLHQKYRYDLKKDEMMYLTLHIERIRTCMTAPA